MSQDPRTVRAILNTGADDAPAIGAPDRVALDYAGLRSHADRTVDRLNEYIARPAVSTERMALTQQGNIRYTLKTPYRDGTTHIVLEPLDFMARLAALVPKPRGNLTRFHGVFAPNSALRNRSQQKPVVNPQQKMEAG